MQISQNWTKLKTQLEETKKPQNFSNMDSEMNKKKIGDIDANKLRAVDFFPDFFSLLFSTKKFFNNNNELSKLKCFQCEMKENEENEVYYVWCVCVKYWLVENQKSKNQTKKTKRKNHYISHSIWKL